MAGSFFQLRRVNLAADVASSSGQRIKLGRLRWKCDALAPG